MNQWLDELRIKFPDADQKALERLTSDGNLFNGSGHQLKEGITKERARAILLLCGVIAKACGYSLVLSKDEQALMGSKFKV